MKFRIMCAFVGAVLLSLTACSDAVVSPTGDDAERALLVARALDLKSKVVAAGEMSLEHRRDLERLAQQITRWQARTGRSDLAVSASRVTRDSTPVAALVAGSPSSPCSSCPSITFKNGYICFLESRSPCNPKDFISQSCGYLCVFVGPGAPPQRS